MPCKPTYAEYMEREIERAEAKLASMTDPDRIARATSYVNYLKRWRIKGIPKGISEESVTVKVRIRER